MNEIFHLHKAEMYHVYLMEDGPSKKHICQVKMYLSKSKRTPQK